MVGICHHFNTIMRKKKALKSSHKSSWAKLKAAQDDLGKTMAQYAVVVSRTERLKAHNSRLKASIA